jgi:hypothetical protein
MGKKDPRVDAYIARSAEFARPILTHLRSRVHEGCPGVVENIKWGVPTFEYHGPMCGMAAFKAHCMFGFWKGALLREGSATTQRRRIDSIEDLPPDAALLRAVRKAAVLNEADLKVPRAVRPKAPVEVPPYMMSAIRRNKRASAAFDALPPSHKREYVEWITEAKGENTRQRRLDTAVAWIAEGKPRNWKYMRK